MTYVNSDDISAFGNIYGNSISVNRFYADGYPGTFGSVLISGGPDGNVYWGAGGGNGAGGSVTSVGGTGNVAGISLAGLVTTAGSLSIVGSINGPIQVTGTLTDGFGSVGSFGQILSSTGSGTQWIPASGGGGGSGSGTVTQVSGSGVVSGISLTGAVTTAGALSLEGALSLTGNQITSALGYTPGPSTIGLSILSGNGNGGFANVTIGGGLSFANGILTTTVGGNGGGAVTQIIAGTGIDISPTDGVGAVTITNTSAGTVTSVSGTGNVSGISLTGLVNSAGGLTLGGTLTLTRSQVTTGLGYTPAQQTVGLSMLAGNGAGGFASVAIGSGLSFAAGTLSATGGGGTTGPMMSYTMTGTQSIPANSTTVILLNVMDFDNTSAYNTTTGRFTPTVAGYYQISWSIASNGTLGEQTYQLWKNGVLYHWGIHFGVSSTYWNMGGGSCAIYLNGSTDYIDTRWFNNSGSIISVNPLDTVPGRFTAAYLGAA